MPITSKDLLEHLTDLQLALEDYSFEKMTAAEARTVKKSYDIFRKQLETRIWDPARKGTIPSENSPKTTHQQYEGALEAIGNDLRNPLHGILGFTQILSEAPIAEPYKSIAASMHMASESMAETLEELGAFYRLKNGGGQAVTIPFSPARILEEAAAYARLQILDKPVDIGMDLEDGLHECLVGNPSDFRRILMNIIQNACRYTLSGRIHITANALKNEKLQELRVEISDSGIGIPEAELPHVFTPYYQGKQAMDLAAKGTGFGLSIVQQLLAKNAGKIEISSREGKGTKVRFTLPFGPVKPAKEISAARANSKDFTNALKGKRILIMENNTLNLDLLQHQLGVMGCAVFTVATVKEGIGLLETQPVDMLLLDLRIQSKKDMQALDEIRSHANSYIRNFPILALSGDINEASGLQLKEAGVDEVILKPFTQEALFNKLKNLRAGAPVQAASLDVTGGEATAGTGLVDLSYLESKCKGDVQSMHILIRALRNGMLEFAGRTRIGLKRQDYSGIGEGAEKLLIALEMIKAHSLIPAVSQIRKASVEGVDENKIIRSFSVYLDRYPEVADALERYMDARD
ncbi:ATP-binding response regulator [Robiginitalea aurantiaca]|uniref:histidine kinase n=1 Tax=Robiginitalea aurantiaca TaxID=3056915 RepID=A0ABT7WFS0_9FLAO|nr:hybrid sensor histidine kinase/response regulator [Robiginitalea aurantiaca]MDM9631769.1 hybrid sensor histidine kinase/response regulator [Robiginitalea aurantiaca]